MAYFRLIVVFAVSLFQTEVTANIIQVNNFSDKINIEQNKTNIYRNDKGIKFRLSNRLIVKATPDINAFLFADLHQAIKSAEVLYRSKTFTYFVLELKEESFLSEVGSLLKNEPWVKLVQPDILQLATKNNFQQTIDEKIEEENVATIQHNGSGIRVAIIDDGFEINHKEFEHIRLVGSYDVPSRTVQVAPQHQKDRHGTGILGILFSQGKRRDARGLIPNAELVAIRQPDTWTSNTVLAFSVAKNMSVDIVNCSWNSPWLLEPVYDVIVDLAEQGRNGKGTAIVFSAGNQGKELHPFQHEASIKQAIVIAAHNKKGQRSAYSNWGQSIDAFFPGHARITTEINGQYGRINGTSLAAALASGYIALLMSEQPSISLVEIEQTLLRRKVKHQMLDQ